MYVNARILVCNLTTISGNIIDWYYCSFNTNKSYKLYIANLAILFLCSDYSHKDLHCISFNSLQYANIYHKQVICSASPLTCNGISVLTACNMLTSTTNKSYVYVVHLF